MGKRKLFVGLASCVVLVSLIVFGIVPRGWSTMPLTTDRDAVMQKTISEQKEGLRGDSISFRKEGHSGLQQENFGNARKIHSSSGMNLVAVRSGEEGKENKLSRKEEQLHYQSSSITDADPKEKRFGEILNIELEKYYAGSESSVKAIDLSDVESDPQISWSWVQMWKKGGSQTVVEIDFSEYSDELVFDTEFFYSQSLYNYYRSAIGKYANLSPFMDCNCLFYDDIGDGKSKMNKILMPTHVEKTQLAKKVEQYKKELELLTDIPEDMTPEEKVLHLYQAIAMDTKYTSLLTDSNDQYNWHVGLGVLIDHDCVCQGYAVVFNQAATMLGLDSEQLFSSGNGYAGHTWNAVRIDSKWYQVDVTWGDTSTLYPALDSVSYSYLFFDDMAMNKEDIYHSATLYSDKFKEVISNQGNAFDQFFPKTAKVSKPFVNLNGVWYYTDGYDLYQWKYQKNSPNQSAKLATLSETGHASIGTYGGKLWFSDSGYGIGTYDPETDAKVPYLGKAVTSMVIRGNMACYQDSDGNLQSYCLDQAEPLEDYKEPELPDCISILPESEDILVSGNAVHKSMDENGNYRYNGYIQSVEKAALLPEYASFILSFQVKGHVREDEELFVVMPYNMEWGGWDATSFKLSDASFREETGEYLLRIPVSDITKKLSSGTLRGVNFEFCETSAILGVTGLYLAKDTVDMMLLPQGRQLKLPNVIQEEGNNHSYIQKDILDVDEADRRSGADSHVKGTENGEYNGYLQTTYKDDFSEQYPYLKVTYQLLGEADDTKPLFVLQPFNMNWGGWEVNKLSLQDSIYDEKTKEYTAYMSIDTVQKSLSEGDLYGVNLCFWSAEPSVLLTGYYMISDIPEQHKKTLEDLRNQLQLVDESGYQIQKESLLTGIKFSENTVSEVCSRFKNANLVCLDTKGNELARTASLMTGATINLKAGDQVKSSCTVVIAGDVVGDGELNLRDVTAVAQYCLNKRTLTEAQLEAADVVADGEVNLRDVTRLAQCNLNKAKIASQK